MIPRYTPPEFAELWSSAHRYNAWLEVELSACEAMEEAGIVPKDVAARIRSKNVHVDADKIDEIEKTVKHDVIAFLTHIEEQVGEDARWLHRGMTSSDVLDTSFAMLLTSACDKILMRTDALIETFERRVREEKYTPMIGRSHGIHAEPITFGLALAGHLAEIKRARLRIREVRKELAVGKIAGAVGTYAHLSPDIEEKALAKLGLIPETVATQVVARDRHAAFFSSLALMAGAIERFATNVRHWQRTEVAEAEEKFTRGQKGSSAMPHKRNPIASENLCGLARLVRAYVVPAFENIALWHERDISHSSVERMIAPDATTTLAYMLERATVLIDGLVVYKDNLRRNLDRTGELYFSEAVLLALVNAGFPRQRGYEIVQKSAMSAIAGSGRFKELLASDPEIVNALGPEKLEQCFDLNHALRHVDQIVERALEWKGP